MRLGDAILCIIPWDQISMINFIWNSNVFVRQNTFKMLSVNWGPFCLELDISTCHRYQKVNVWCETDIVSEFGQRSKHSEVKNLFSSIYQYLYSASLILICIYIYVVAVVIFMIRMNIFQILVQTNIRSNASYIYIYILTHDIFLCIQI